MRVLFCMVRWWHTGTK